MFYLATLIGWLVFNAYSGFTMFVLWVCYSVSVDAAKHDAARGDSR